METKFNFSSAICTDRNQSERLLALGLKKETADMVHYISAPMKEWGILATPWRDDYEGCYSPAWSLHRLIEMMPRCIIITFIDNIVIIEQYKAFQKSYGFWDDVYDNIVDCIEWLIKEGYFNKEYLEE